jgi:hypothetical protein
MRSAFGRARGRSLEVVREILRQEALAIYHEDIANNRALGRYGAVLLKPRTVVLTHCNAGALATAGYGTALGVIRAAKEAGKSISVFATETRPFLQGARLTAWELKKDRIPVTLITDSMVGHFMKRGHLVRDRGRRPGGGQRRRGQQDRHVHRGGSRGAAQDPVLRRRADFDDRPRLQEWRGHSDRGAERARGNTQR